MGIFFIIFSMLVTITILIPLLLAEKWIENPHRIRSRIWTGKSRRRYIGKTKVKNNFISLFAPMISMQTRIAKSDGNISASEAEYIKNTISYFISIAGQEGLSDVKLRKLRQELVEAHKKAKENDTLISVYSKKLQHANPYIKEQVLQQLISIAVTGGYTQLKESLIFNAGTAMGMGSLQVRRYIDAMLGVKKEPPKDNVLYEILGCSSTDSNATIKNRYRELVKKNHPDLIQSRELNRSSVESAKKKMQEINMAYGKIKQERGM